MRWIRKRRKNGKRKPVSAKAAPAAGKESVEPGSEAAAPVGTEAEKEAETQKGQAIIKADSERVFYYFREISSIPRGSRHTKAISDYLVAFAKEKGLSYVQDEANNVIISKKASEGFESAKPIALQGHIDMVLASEPGRNIDMLTEPVHIITEGDWMRADGTTLGADNGVAVSMMLAALESDKIAHPYLECIFTSDEEIGLVGANAIDLSGLKSRRLLNLDSETEGVFCVSCAGGAEVVSEMPLKKKNRAGKILNLRVSGLRGGHSGTDIAIGSANGNVLMARMLRLLFVQCPFRLISISGGDADNAIATGAKASVLFSAKAPQEMIAEITQAAARQMEQEYEVTDPNMQWQFEWEEAESAKAASRKDTNNLLQYLMSVPNGVTQMSPVRRDLPQTSLNLGVIRTQGDTVRVELMVRGNVNSQAAYLTDRLVCLTKGFGGKSLVRHAYPAWEYKEESPLRDLAAKTYKDLTGREPALEVIHAGLECGILAGKLEGLDCLSAGPDLENVHTVRERMKISSVENVWTFVLALLAGATV